MNCTKAGSSRQGALQVLSAYHFDESLGHLAGQQAAYITSDEHCCIAPRIRTIPNCQVAQAAPMWMEMDAGQQKIDKSPLENQ